WSSAVPCLNQTCILGTCQGSCAPNGLGCSGNQPQQCDASGNWQNSGSACAPPTPSCLSGACVCATQTCNGACVDESSDPNNCGACGKVCSPWETCAASSCACDPSFVADANQGVYVSGSTGSDTLGDGSLAKPYATLTRGITSTIALGLPNV